MVNVHNPHHGGPSPPGKREESPPLVLDDEYDRETWKCSMERFQTLTQEEQGVTDGRRKQEIAKEKARIKAWLQKHEGAHKQDTQTGYSYN